MHPPLNELYFFIVDTTNKYDTVLISPVVSNAFAEIGDVLDGYMSALDVLSEANWSIVSDERKSDGGHIRRGLLHLDATDRLRLLAVLDEDIVQTFEATHPERIAVAPEVWTADVTRSAFLSLFLDGYAFTGQVVLRDARGALVEFNTDQAFVDVVDALGDRRRRRHPDRPHARPRRGRPEPDHAGDALRGLSGVVSASPCRGRCPQI